MGEEIWNEYLRIRKELLKTLKPIAKDVVIEEEEQQENEEERRRKILFYGAGSQGGFPYQFNYQLS